MKPNRRALLSVAVLLAMSQPVWAIIVQGTGMAAKGTPAAKPDAHAPVERGGTITATNKDKKTISVDGVSYPLASGTVAVHYDGAPGPGSVFKLKPGTKIRFNTVRDSGGQDRVHEVWVGIQPVSGAKQ